MTTDKMTQIKSKMKSGDVQGAAAELKAFLAAEPDNAEAQMLYGTCCHLLGDDKTFGEIHDALAPKMEKETDEKKLSLWRKYHAIWLTLLTAGLVIGGWCYVHRVVEAMFRVAGTAVPGSLLQLYGGPKFKECKLARTNTNETCQVCHGTGLQRGRLCTTCGGYGKGRLDESEFQVQKHRFAEDNRFAEDL